MQSNKRLNHFLPVAALTTLLVCGTFADCQESSLEVDFSADVLPILVDHCFECHGPDEASRQSDLRLDVQDGLFAEYQDGRAVVRPGAPASSELLDRIKRDDDSRMPPPEFGESLSDAEIELVERWIENGAQWSKHWSLIAPVRPSLPPTRLPSASTNPIDLFVQSKLSELGLTPSLEADKHALIRRVTLDLTGLPPTVKEVEAFLADNSPMAYERLVDRLLASPRYGERMAIPWLDAARYADTHGYLFDTERSMWRWRDWVIDAFNGNQPFDQFTIEQLAGDLYEDPTESQRIATGFNRNHLINNEAGAIAEEYLVENVIDRVNTTATVWMGLSLACCQCHDHKYDPFTQREYYELYAFFNTLPEVGLDGLNANARPVMTAPTERDRLRLANLRQRLAESEKQMALHSAEIEHGQIEWEATLSKNDETPLNGLIASWPFDQTPSDTSHVKDATVFEAAPAAYEEGILGFSASLEGLGYLNAGDRFNFMIGDAFSFGAWVKISQQAGRLTVLSRMKNAEALFRGYALQMVEGFPAFFLVHQFPDNLIQVQGKEALLPDQWYHLTVTYDGSGKAAGVKLYLDGELQEPGIVIDTLTEPIEVDHPFWIGNGHPAAKFKGSLDELRVYERVLDVEEVKKLPGLAISSLINVESHDRTSALQRRLRDFYLAHHAPVEWRESFDTLAMLKEEVRLQERSLPTVMIMEESNNPRETRILERGAYNKPGDKVSPNTPMVLPDFDEQWPRNRLGLARWLVDEKHPLTARVAVNRFWQHLFGVGLVSTSEDFGLQGELPSHPELLDWLAVEFVENGWDMKAIQRLIVTSATYRQSSKTSDELLFFDPDNRWLARGPRRRLPAELIRDQALAISGLLVDSMGGPSVKPYQPQGLWRDVAFDFSGGNLTAQVYQQDSGASLYRRSLYTFWKRTAPPPTMLIFDAPDRERCVVRRERTNTPLQALVLMNDPTYVEAARKLAERILTDIEDDQSRRLEYAFKLVLARPPTSIEIAILQDALVAQLRRFDANLELADQLLGVGATETNATLDRSEVAAYTVIASIILNLDETISTQ